LGSIDVHPDLVFAIHNSDGSVVLRDRVTTASLGLRPGRATEAGGELFRLLDNPLIIGESRELSNRNAVGGELIGPDIEFWKRQWWVSLELNG